MDWGEHGLLRAVPAQSAWVISPQRIPVNNPETSPWLHSSAVAELPSFPHGKSRPSSRHVNCGNGSKRATRPPTREAPSEGTSIQSSQKTSSTGSSPSCTGSRKLHKCTT